MPRLTVTFKGRERSVHNLETGRTLIGRSSECQVCIDSLAIAPRHAEVLLERDRCRVSALDETLPTRVNGAPVDSAELHHGDLIGIGKHMLTFNADGPSESVRAETTTGVKPASLVQTDAAPSISHQTRQRTYLQILSGEHIGRIIPLNRNMLRLGKAGGDCAIIVHRDDRYFLSHLEGQAPVVNGVPIGEESVMLDKGSTIRIGDTRFQFFH